jgi:hypothetical protein
MRIAFYISGHGLGHASRDIELMSALLTARPDARIVVRTSAPGWIFERTAPRSIELQPLEADTGVVQIDSLHLDEEATAREAARFYRDFDRRVDAEARVLADLRADVVVGDIPPLAFAAAHRAQVPSVALGNFTWDWIYSIYDAFAREAPDVIPLIAHAYSRATRALRLPLHGGFASMRAVTCDIPFIARRSTRERRETRRLLGLRDDRPAVLTSFGGHGVALPDAIARSSRFALVGSDTSALDVHGLSYQDLVAAVDVVVSKPGYGIVSECVANNAALIYTSRGRFIEYDLFVPQMPRFLRCRFLSPEDFNAGRWEDAIDAVLDQPPPPERPPIDGAAIAARTILETAERRRQTR